MKCSRIQMRMMEFEQGGLPADIAEHIAACAGCKTHWERTRSVRLLMALKRHEKPDAGFETRCLGAIRTRIAELDVAEQLQPVTWWERLVGSPVSSLRYGLATVLVLLIGLQVVSISEFPVLQPAPQASIEQPAAPARFAAATNLPADAGLRALPLLVASPSNVDAGGISYGPGSSMPVNYEY